MLLSNSALKPAIIAQLTLNQSETRKTLNLLDTSQPPAKVEQYLGSEFQHILFDANNTFDPNLFAALSGTLTAGGCFIVSLPPIFAPILNRLAKSQDCANNLLEQIAKFPLSACLKRLVQFSLTTEDVAYIGASQYRLPGNHSKQTLLPDHAEQQQLIDKICRVATGHAKRPLVLLANRGRGKTAALGIAASKLMLEHHKRIILTAPTWSNISSFYKHLTIPHQSQRQINLENGAQLRFMAVDQIIKEKPEADLLMIDEAAAIPVQLLDEISQGYNRMVFSSTSDGYEGNGKGFEIRFQRRLIKSFPQTRFAALAAPIRWSGQDSLEPLCYRTFLLHHELADISSLANVASLNFVQWQQSDLAANESLLQQIFSLLVNAHYQTRPADLEQILANPNLTVTGLMDQNKVLAVALLNSEGGFSEEECEQIALRKKRLKGELLPQSLMAHCGNPAIGRLKFSRVMRIAVHPQCQRKGLGSQLLDAITNNANRFGVDFIGASFSAETEVVNFWSQNQFQMVHLGGAKDSSSGQNSCEMLKALSQPADTFKSGLCDRFISALLYKLNGELADMDSELVALIISTHASPELKRLTAGELGEIEAFSVGTRGFSSLDYLVAKWALHQLTNPVTASMIGMKNCAFLIDMLLKQSPNAVLSARYSLTGKKQIISQLRHLIRQVVETKDHAPNESTN